jgi:beta-lactamase regulating signal transducer with metallopeptidase domain
MSSLVCWIASYLINSLWEVCVIGGAGWLASRWLKRLGPGVEHVVWVSTLVLAVVTPALPLWRWLSGFVSAFVAVHPHSSFVLITAGSVNANVKGIPRLSPGIIDVVLLLYGIALLYFAVRLSFSMYRTVLLRRDACAISLDAGKDELWRRCRRAFSIGDALVLSSARIAGPVTIALREPVLLLPHGFFEECDDEEFLAAVAHECAHMKRRDFQKNLFYEVASLVIAIHPVTWLVKSQIAQTREMICDEMAIEKLVDTETYTQSLLRLATMVALRSRVRPSHAIGIFDANILEKRVMMMNATKRQFSAFVKYGLIVPAALLLFSVATGAGAMGIAIAPETSSQADGQGKPYGQVYKIGKDVSAPVLIYSAEAEFPKSAKDVGSKFEGTCLIELVVDETGVPEDVHVVRTLRKDFDESSIESVRQYRFKPAMKAGTPVAVSLKVEVNFAKF